MSNSGAWDMVHETDRTMLTHLHLWTLSSIVFSCDITFPLLLFIYLLSCFHVPWMMFSCKIWLPKEVPSFDVTCIYEEIRLLPELNLMSCHVLLCWTSEGWVILWIVVMLQVLFFVQDDRSVYHAKILMQIINMMMLVLYLQLSSLSFLGWWICLPLIPGVAWLEEIWRITNKAMCHSACRTNKRGVDEIAQLIFFPSLSLLVRIMCNIICHDLILQRWPTEV